MKKWIMIAIGILWLILPFQNTLEAREVKYIYRVEYFYDGVRELGKTETREASLGDQINSYIEKNKDGFTLFYSTIDEDALTITDQVENNLIRVYYVREDTGNDEAYQRSKEHTPKTGIHISMDDSSSLLLWIINTFLSCFK